MNWADNPKVDSSNLGLVTKLIRGVTNSVIPFLLPWCPISIHPRQKETPNHLFSVTLEMNLVYRLESISVDVWPII
jgi:hypothetical protein